MGIYHREKAVQYADQWWNNYNPQFRSFEVDCTNYVSQCLWAGGAPMDYGNKSNGWWYKWGATRSTDTWSYSWSVSHSFRWYLQSGYNRLKATEVTSPSKLTIGDVILYDFDGDGKWQHSTIVTAITLGGMPLVNAHTVNSKRRYWDYKDSHAWTPQINYKFFHIADLF